MGKKTLETRERAQRGEPPAMSGEGCVSVIDGAG